MFFRFLTAAISRLADEVRELRLVLRGQDEAALKGMAKKLDSAGEKLAEAVKNNQPTQK